MRGSTALAGLGTALLLLSLLSPATAREHTLRWQAHRTTLRDATPQGQRSQSGGIGTGTGLFVVETEADVQKLAELHATPKGELLFTTFQFLHKGQYNKDAVQAARHLWQNLQDVGILNHTIVLSYHAPSCRTMWEHGIPCFLDRFMAQPDSLPGQYKADVPHWYQKYAWALKFIELGYVTAFVEMDMVFLQNPLPYYNPNYDLEGLSDWADRADLGRPQDRFTKPCPVYHTQKRDDGGNHLEWGAVNPGDVRSTTHINACMSTGFWFVQPTAPAKALLSAFSDLQLHWRDWQNDQQLWNEVLMAFLVGSGQQRPLHFSLLDHARFSNFDVWELRTKAGLRSQPVMLHCGNIHGGAKEEYMRRNDFWRGDSWDGTAAAPHIAALSQYFKRELSQ